MRHSCDNFFAVIFLRQNFHFLGANRRRRAARHSLRQNAPRSRFCDDGPARRNARLFRKGTDSNVEYKWNKTRVSFDHLELPLILSWLVLNFFSNAVKITSPSGLYQKLAKNGRWGDHYARTGVEIGLPFLPKNLRILYCITYQ